MKSNSKKIGTAFEKDFRASVPFNLYCDRYKDSPVKYRKVNNPADYFINAGGYLLLVECKTTKDNSLPVDNIRMEQIWKMLEHTCKLNTFGGLLINYRSFNETYFVFVSDFVYWYLHTTNKSLPISWVRNNGYKLASKKKVTRFTYGISGLLNWIKEVKYIEY